MTIEPLGRRVSIYSNGRTWLACYFITDSAPTRAAAEAASGAFVSAYVSGYRDGLRDLIAMWRNAKMWVEETWGVTRITDWLLGAVNRLAPGLIGAA